MGFSRGCFLKGVATIGIGTLLLVFSLGGGAGTAYGFNQSPQIRLFSTALRGVGPGQIPVAAPDPLPAATTGVTHYSIGISQFMDQILPSGFNRTTLWGFHPLSPLGGGIQYQKHLGGIIVGKGRNPNDPTDKNVPIQITFRNLLNVSKHIIPVDTTIPGANQAVNRTAVHLHGGLVPWISDGGPFDWWTPSGAHGLSFLNNKVLAPAHFTNGAEYYYPLNQSARFMWYHDHAVGITRLNAYAGVASGMLIRDKFEAGLIDGSGGVAQGLPPYIENSVLGGKPVLELPIVVQDKIFVGPDILQRDPTWATINLQPVTQKPGSLWYAHVYEPNRWEVFPGGLDLPNPSAIPEFFGDTMLVNGTTYPETTVQARRYRLRLLNACNARFLNLQLYVDNGTLNGVTLNANGVPTNPPFVNAATGDPSWLQIGTEGGFLARPAKIPSNVPFLITDPDFLAGGPSLDPTQINRSLIVAPAERPDVIVDFSSVPPGTKVVLYNDAPSPFPSGDDVNDYFPGLNTSTNPVNATTAPGFGPNTRVLMRFRVVAATGNPDVPLTITAGNGGNPPTDLSGGIDPSLLPSWGYPNNPGVPTRVLTLNEFFDEWGRLIQIIGNAEQIYGSPYDVTATYLNYGPPAGPFATQTIGSTRETVYEGDTEVWEVYNTTGDTHPMHIHLANAQVVNRQTFDPVAWPYNTFGPIIPPLPDEIGWKETIPMYPGTVTRMIMRWDLSPIVGKNLNPVNSVEIPGFRLAIKNGRPPESPRTGGHEYVWHCHILEHEEHDMMHSLVVLPRP